MAAQHQHYVPQLLLRGFLSRDPDKAAKEQVHVFDLETGVSFTPSISNIIERRFNDFWLDEETLATVEPAAGRIESHVAPLVERIRRERRLERSPERNGRPRSAHGIPVHTNQENASSARAPQPAA